MKKIVHLTSVHPRYDTRIFVKECSSLAKNRNYDVHLIVADGKGNEIKNNIKIIDVGKPKNRLYRILFTTKRIYKKALEIDANIYHLHDPELLRMGNKLSVRNKKVIFDSHEDVPLQILSKSYLNKYIRIFLSKLSNFYEKKSCNRYNFIITPTQFIKNKFIKINQHTDVIYNYPIQEEVYIDKPLKQINKINVICYIGSITEVRGIKKIVKALEYVKSDIKLNLGGKFVEQDVANEVKAYSGWKKVNELGFLNRNQVKEILYKSKIGMVTLYPTINYKDALPVKMFEYMAAGLPIIASDIPLWKSIIDKAQCGICVNPYKPKEIAQAIDKLINNPTLADKMGENGKRAILAEYNWNNEEKKLFGIYNRLLNNKHT